VHDQTAGGKSQIADYFLTPPKYGNVWC